MKEFQLLNELIEAKLFGGGISGIKKYNAREIADLLFLHIIALQIMKKQFHGLPKIQEYLKKTGNLINFDSIMYSRNEVYIFIHILFGGKQADRQRALLKDQEASQALINTLSIDFPQFRRFFRLLMIGKTDQALERRFLLALERDLKIDNSYYRAMRRLSSNWERQSNSSKKLVITRLLQVLRSIARRSELTIILEQVSRQERMVNKKLKPLSGEGPGQKIPASQSKRKMGLLPTLAAAGAAGVGGYYLTRRKK